MNHLHHTHGVGRDAASPGPETLLPLLFDPDTGHMFWLDGAARRTVSRPVHPDGHVSLGAVADPPPGNDERSAVIRTLLDDIATYTCRPLPLPIAAPERDGYDEYAVVWVDNACYAATPRDAAEQAWRTIRRPGSHACVFQVVNRRTGQRTDVDLLDEPDNADGHTGQQDSAGGQL
jgi:hypothetical protein